MEKENLLKCRIALLQVGDSLMLKETIFSDWYLCEIISIESEFIYIRGSHTLRLKQIQKDDIRIKNNTLYIKCY
jgi:hypothetical protein